MNNKNTPKMFSKTELLFLWAIFQQHFFFLTKPLFRLYAYFNPYIHITISEYSEERMKRSDAYALIQAYLSTKCSKTTKNMRAELGKDSTNMILSMDDFEKVTDEFSGVKLQWSAGKNVESRPMFFMPMQGQSESKEKFFHLRFHSRHRDLVVDQYLDYVIKEGREVSLRNRRRKLYTNLNPRDSWMYDKKNSWKGVDFEHPASFETVAMHPEKKREILDDLESFKNGSHYYKKIGKAWKRGYLLYGPPGTGKSTIIAAIANYLDYDIYDLELTSVKSNTDLRKLFIDTTNKSIIVIEDIDCSLDLTGKRKEKKEKEKKPWEEKEEKVTLSGLLNFIDGLWSACGGERLIIFTTNHKERLDEALIRRGRMDKHIEMSYCCFQAFKVLANNYLGVEEEHPLLDDVRRLLGDVAMSPADVAEWLMPKCKGEGADECIGKLVKELESKKKTSLDDELKAMEISESNEEESEKSESVGDINEEKC